MEGRGYASSPFKDERVFPFNDCAVVQLYFDIVHDDMKRIVGLDNHCTGREWVDDSSIALLPLLVDTSTVTQFESVIGFSMNRAGFPAEVKVNSLVGEGQAEQDNGNMG